LDNIDVALQFFNRAITINIKKKLFKEIASNYYMISSVYSEKGKYEIALDYINKALEMDKYVENSLGIAKDYRAMGIISKKIGKESDAYTYFKNSLFIYRSIKTILPNFVLEKEMKTLFKYLIPLAEKIDDEAAVTNYKKMLEKIEE